MESWPANWSKRVLKTKQAAALQKGEVARRQAEVEIQKELYESRMKRLRDEMGVETICPTLWSATQIKSLLENQE